MMDIWDVSAYGLIDDRCRRRLVEIDLGSLKSTCENSSESTITSAQNWSLSASRTSPYIPYQSTAAPRSQRGDDRGRQALDLSFSEEVQSSVVASPLGKAIANIIATQRECLWQEGRNSSEGLALVASIAPRKGREANILAHEYVKKNIHATRESAMPMVLRDFVASSVAWTFIRCPDGSIPDLVGSMICLTIAPDFVGVRDSPGPAEFDPYIAAASGGAECMAGTVASTVMRDVVMSNSIMIAKDEMVNHSTPIPAPKNPVTPLEFSYVRWLDGIQLPYYRALFSSAYEYLGDGRGNFRSADACGKIKRGLVGSIRYDEAVDLISDYFIREPINETCMALAVGGSNSVYGYGDACARVTDDALTCSCGVDGHQEAAEFNMGFCMWYWLVPRYIGPKQLRHYTAAGAIIQKAYAWPPAGERLRSVANCVLDPGHILHDATWQPLWKKQKPPLERNVNQSALVHQIAQRILRRCLVADYDDENIEYANALAGSVLQDCDALEDVEDLRGLSVKWSALFKAVVKCTSAPSHGPLQEELSSLVGRIWDHTLIGLAPSPMADEADFHLFLDFDGAIRKTYLLPVAEGHPVRRAVFGIASSQLELSGIGPYIRLCDGSARMHNQWG